MESVHFNNFISGHLDTNVNRYDRVYAIVINANAFSKNK